MGIVATTLVRPEAVRLVVISEHGEQAEATLGAAKDIRLVLR